MQQSKNSGFSLRLSDGRSLVLAKGVNLSEKDLPGLHSIPPGGPVAVVNSHPTDPNICGLQNLSHLPWRVRLANGDIIEVKPGKNVRLAPGSRIRFGAIEVEVRGSPHPATHHADANSAGSRQAASNRFPAWLRMGLVGASLVVLASGGWYLQHHLSAEAARRKQIAAEEQRAREEAARKAKAEKVGVEATPVQSSNGVAVANAQSSGSDGNGVSEDELKDSAAGSTGVYGMQGIIDFDCLDGAIIDPASGNLSLFGHRARPDRLLHIPYFDYLATALECKAPTFSLEFTPSSFTDVLRASKKGQAAILEATTTKRFDSEDHLTPAGAWYLQQNGVPVTQGMSYMNTLARMLEVADHPKTAAVAEDCAAWYGAEGDAASEAALLKLYKTVGVDASYQDVVSKRSARTVPDDQIMDEFYPKFFAALGDSLEANGQHYADEYQRSRAKGRSVSEAFMDAEHALNNDVKDLWDRTLGLIASKNPMIQVPSSIVTSVTGGVVPVGIHPLFTDLPPRSMLARIAFQGDVACKYIMYAPELKTVVPGYRTEIEFDRANGRSSGNGYERIEIVPGKFELSQTPDGNMVRFTSSKMTFNLRKVIFASNNTRTDAPDPVLKVYEAELTNEYDAFAQAVPVLQNVREAEKAVALARWIQKRGFQITLPKEGRGEWSPPGEEYSGINLMFLVTEQSGSMRVYSRPWGGVDLRANPTIRDGGPDTPSGSQIVAPTNGADLDSVERDARARLAAATTKKDQVAAEMKLALVLALKGNKDDSTKELNAALRLDPNPPGQQEVYKAWMGSGTSAAKAPVTTVAPNGTQLPITPMEWPNQNPDSFPANPEDQKVWGESQFRDHQFGHLKPYSSPHLPQPEPFQLPKKPEDQQKLNKYIDDHPDIKKQIDDNRQDWEKKDKEYQDKLKTDPGQAAQIKQQMEDQNKKLKGDLKKKTDKDPDYQKLNVVM